MVMRGNSFRFLWMGQMFANAGDVFYLVGILSVLFTATRSIAITAAVPFAVTLARFLGGLTAPLIIDHFSHKKVLVFSQMIKTALLMVVVVIFAFPVANKNEVFIIFPFISFIAFFDGWATPIRNAMIPLLVPQEKLIRVNGFVAMVDQIVQLGSWPIGSIIVSITSGRTLLIIMVVLFTVSTLFMSFIAYEQKRTANIILKKKKWESFKEGWELI